MIHGTVDRAYFSAGNRSPIIYMTTVAGCLLLLFGVALTNSAQIAITEIHYHPVEEPSFNADGTPKLDLTQDVYEFVELQNISATTIDLAGWKLSGGISYLFPSNTTVGP